jgi:hypothetical protein
MPFETALPDPFDWSDLGSRTARPEMARLTLARKIATVVLIVWKRGASSASTAFHLNPDGEYGRRDSRYDPDENRHQRQTLHGQPPSESAHL